MKKKSSFVLLLFLLFIIYFSLLKKKNFLRFTKEQKSENEKSLEKCKNGKKKIYNNFIQGTSIIFSKYIDEHSAESFINYDLEIETNKKKNYLNLLKRYGPYLFFAAIGIVALICWFLYFCCLCCEPKCCFVHNSKKDSGVRKYSFVISILCYCGLICCCVSGIIIFWKTRSNINSCECCIERFYYDFTDGEIKNSGKRFIGFDSIIKKFENIKDFISSLNSENFDRNCEIHSQTDAKLLAYVSKINDLKSIINYINNDKNTILEFLDNTVKEIESLKKDFKNVNEDYVEKFTKYSKKYFTKYGKFFLVLFFLIALIISLLIIIFETKYVFGENQSSLKVFLIILFNISTILCIYSFIISSVLGIFSYFTSDLITYIKYSVEKDTKYNVITNENSYNLIQHCLYNDGKLNNYLNIDKGMTDIFNMIYNDAKFIIDANSNDIENININNDENNANNDEENEGESEVVNNDEENEGESEVVNFEGEMLRQLDQVKEDIIKCKSLVVQIFNDYINKLKEDDLGDDLFNFCDCSFLKRNLNLTYESYYDLRHQIISLTTVVCFGSFFLLFGTFCLLFNIFHFNKKIKNIQIKNNNKNNNNFKIGKGFRYNNYDEKTVSERKNINEKSESDTNTIINNLANNSNDVNINKINNNTNNNFNKNNNNNNYK